jgi:hypothetical protein
MRGQQRQAGLGVPDDVQVDFAVVVAGHGGGRGYGGVAEAGHREAP